MLTSLKCNTTLKNLFLSKVYKRPADPRVEWGGEDSVNMCCPACVSVIVVCDVIIDPLMCGWEMAIGVIVPICITSCDKYPVKYAGTDYKLP